MDLYLVRKALKSFTCKRLKQNTVQVSNGDSDDLLGLGAMQTALKMETVCFS
jgi:hypothetical protein